MKERCFSPKINTDANANCIQDTKNDALASMMKKYTYRFLKSPNSIINENLHTNEVFQKRGKSIHLNFIYVFHIVFDMSKLILVRVQHDAKRVEPKLNQQRVDMSHEIIFNSPFYKKRNKITSTFRHISSLISKEEIDKFSTEFWSNSH